MRLDGARPCRGGGIGLPLWVGSGAVALLRVAQVVLDRRHQTARHGTGGQPARQRAQIGGLEQRQGLADGASLEAWGKKAAWGSDPGESALSTSGTKP